MVARQWRSHIAAGEQQGHDDLDGGTPAKALTADSRARRLSALPEQLDQQIRQWADEAPLRLKFTGATAADCRTWQAAFLQKLRERFFYFFRVWL